MLESFFSAMEQAQDRMASCQAARMALSAKRIRFLTGIRYQQDLYAFSGKDLFWAMDGWFKENGFFGAWAFREQILKKMTTTPEDVADWAPEWREWIRQVRGTPA
ncbi:MAG: hypothetical protein H7839_01515 [Magnetococcus sp. YQC-5]